MLEVSGVVLDHGAGPLKIRWQSDRGDLFVDLPHIEGFVNL